MESIRFVLDDACSVIVFVVDGDVVGGEESSSCSDAKYFSVSKRISELGE